MNENPRQDIRRFGDYEVLCDASGEPWLLGSGSYGQTYKARNILLGTELAIKVIRSDLSMSESVRQRFFNEGRALAHLVHEHIALLRHFGISDASQIYYVMDYCAGGTLAQRVTRLGPRPPGEALEIVRQATCALVAAHAQGVIHRDLKPSNLMLTHAPPPLHVKVIDFGLAQASVVAAAGGRFHGTAQWASPEQLREDSLDGRSDLFSLGLILWFLLVGRPPDTGSAASIMQRRLDPGGYAGHLPLDLPPDIRDLLGSLLETDPDRRVGSAMELRDRLERLAASHPYTALNEALDDGPDSVVDGLPRLSEEASMDERYARLTRLHRDLAGEWFEAELEGQRGTRIIFVLHEQWAQSPDLRAKVRSHLVRLARRPVDGLPHFLVLLENKESFVAEWAGGGGGGDFASWIKLRRKSGLHEVIGFLAGVARVTDEAIDLGVPGVGLMAFQVRVETNMNPDGDGLSGLAARLFPLLLGADDLPPDLNESTDTSGSTRVLVDPELACDRFHMLARLIYRAMARREAADAVAFTPAAYIALSALSESGNEILRETLSRRRRWDRCMSLMRALATKERLSLTGSGSGKRRVSVTASAQEVPEMTGSRNLPAPPVRPPRDGAKPEAAGACDDPPSMIPSSLSPIRSTLSCLSQLGERVPKSAWLVIGLGVLALGGMQSVRFIGGHRTDWVRQPSVESPPAIKGPAAAMARGEPYLNALGMRFVEAGTRRVLFCVWETRVGDFHAFVKATGHDAISNNAFGTSAYTMVRSGENLEPKQVGASWRDPLFPSDSSQNDHHPVVCVSYHDAEAFCKWLTVSDQNLSSTWRYRLPTDQEWSEACPDTFQWPGDNPPRDVGNYCGSEAMSGTLLGAYNELAQAGWADEWPRTAPVGKFSPNRYGLYDMGGNVWEWCSSFVTDKDGPKLRVLRGASWMDWRYKKLCANYQECDNPLTRNDYSGFRVVLANDTLPSDE